MISAIIGEQNGVGKITKVGAGTMALTGANTYTGVTTINEGTLQIGNAGTTGTLGSGSVVNNATLSFYRTDNSTFSGTMTGTGTLQVAKGGTLILASGANVTQGSISGGDGNVASAGAGNFTVQAGASLTATSSFYLGNQASQAGTLNQTGGTVNLSTSTGDNIRIGHWPSESSVYNLSGGTLNAINTDTTLSWDGTGTVAVSGGIANLRGVKFNRGTGTGGGTLNLSGTGTLNLGAGGIYDGSTAANSIAINFSGGTLGSLAAWTSSLGITLTNTTTIDTTGGNIGLSGILTSTGGITKAGAGILTLTGANTYAGGTTLNQGTLTVGTGGTIGAATGALSVNNTNTGEGNASILNLSTAVNTTTGSLSGTIATPSGGVNTATINTQAGRTLTVNQIVDGTFAGVIAGTGDFVLGSSSTNTLTLMGINTYTGTTTVSAGTLALVGGSQASPITVSTGASLSFTLGSPTTSTSSFDVTAGTIKISGTPTLPRYTLISSSTGITGTPTLNAAIPGYVLQKYGNSLVLETLAQNLYQAWADTTYVPPLTAKLLTDDQDTDGLNNLKEYAFGTHPTVNSVGPITYASGVVTSTGQPVIVQDGGVWYAVYGRRIDYVAAGLTYTVEFSNNLTPWTADVTTPTVIATDGVIEAVRVPFPNFVDGPSGPQKPQFFRVVITSSF